MGIKKQNEPIQQLEQYEIHGQQMRAGRTRLVQEYEVDIKNLNMSLARQIQKRDASIK